MHLNGYNWFLDDYETVLFDCSANFSYISNIEILAIADLDALLVFLFKHYNSIEYQKLRVLTTFELASYLFREYTGIRKLHIT